MEVDTEHEKAKLNVRENKRMYKCNNIVLTLSNSKHRLKLTMDNKLGVETFDSLGDV